MSLYSRVVFLIFISQDLQIPASSCTVPPPAAAFVIRNNISVTCLLENGEFVNQWKHESRTVYQAETWWAGRLITNRSAADGYAVNDTVSSPSQCVLTLINPTVAYVGKYYCQCQTGQSDSAYIAIIDDGPSFVSTKSLTVDDPVTLTCSLSVAGIVNSSIQIVDSSGYALCSNNTSFQTNISHTQSVSCNVIDLSKYVYKCFITISSNPNGRQPNIFSKEIEATVQFSVRNISITPDDPTCGNNSFCSKNVPVSCRAIGSPAPGYQWTIIYHNSIVTNASSDKYITDYIGEQVIRCTACNNISCVSADFSTNVTEDVYSRTVTTGPRNIPLIVGLVVGLGGGIILIIIIIIFILCLCKRKKRRTACCEPEQQKEGKEEVQIEANTYEGFKGKDKAKNGSVYEGTIKKKQKEKPKGPPATKASGKTKGTKEIDETTLVDNNLYSKTDNDENNVDSVYNTSIHGEDNPVMSVYNTSIHGVDPSDGGYADLDEFGAKGKY